MTTDYDFESLSAESDSLLPVQLEAQDAIDYSTIFYPNPGVSDAAREKREASEKKREAQALADGVEFVPKKFRESKSGITQEQFYHFAKYLAVASSKLNMVFALARYLTENSTLFSIKTKEEINAQVDAAISRLESESESSIEPFAHRYVTAMRSGTNQIIVNGSKYKDGFDVIFSGLPNGSTMSARSSYGERLEVPEGDPSSYAYQARISETGVYNTDIGKAALDMVSGLSDSSIENAHKRTLKVVPLGFNFDVVLKQALNNPKIKALGIKIDLSKFEVKYPQELVTSFSKYFGIVIVREANSEAVKYKKNPSRSQNFNQHALALNPSIGLSMVIHLSPEIAGYIAQTPKGVRPPLTALNTWASLWVNSMLKAPGVRQPKGSGLAVHPKDCPRYVLSASSTKMLADTRKALGFYAESGRSNPDGIFIANNGALHFCPKSSELDFSNALSYEKILEDALRISFEAGTPLASGREGETNEVFGLASPEYASNIALAKTKLKKFAGVMQSYSWDFDCALSSSSEHPEKLRSVSLSGATVPDELALGDYLRKPFASSMQLLFPRSTVGLGGIEAEKVSKNSFGHYESHPVSMFGTSAFLNMFNAYSYLLSEKLVPSFQKLVEESAKEMNITSLDQDEDLMDIERNLYAGYITNDLKVTPNFGEDAPVNTQVMVIQAIYSKVLRDAGGDRGSNLARICLKNGSRIEEHSHYFNPTMALHEIKNTYLYLGGHVFYKMLQSIATLDRKSLLSVNTENPKQAPSFNNMMREVLPLAIMLSKYVPSSEDILQKADALAEKFVKDTNIGPEDIHVPGSKASTDTVRGLELFPHQVAGQQVLRNAPRFAILDVAPGGGKTISVLTDICNLIHEAKIAKPLVIAPDNLVKNWVEDLHKITDGKWNAIPITTAVMNSPHWGTEKLTELIKSAPRNTIVVAGLRVLQSGDYQIVIGEHAKTLYRGMEFLKKFGFDYVAVDECHRVKNMRTENHQSVKQLCTSSAVKYVRLATGTLVSNVLSDVVGQSAMFSSQIFRTPKEFEVFAATPVGENISDAEQRGLRGKLTRERLSKYCAVITAKRKEWAFMLPVPIETFLSVDMEKSPEEGGDVQSKMYEVILKIAADMMTTDEGMRKILSGSDDESIADAVGNADETDTPKVRGTRELSDEQQAKFEAALVSLGIGPRLEQMLTDPMGDELGKEHFAGYREEHGGKEFISNKVLKVIERIRLSFTDNPWVKGKTYYLRPEKIAGVQHLRGVIDHEGKHYILMPKDGVPSSDASYYAPYVSTIDPTNDPRWKIEQRGKVLVFCRYNRTTEAIFRALPPDLKKIAATFCGTTNAKNEHHSAGDKYKNLGAFKRDPWVSPAQAGKLLDAKKYAGIQILIANEQAISEGHNLQMADRLIRVESPWTPGELDQAQSRIFRPDPKAEWPREVVYLDWIVTNGSMEVPKMGRLISKIIEKTQFDEVGNELYDVLRLPQHQHPQLKMNPDVFLSSPSLSDIGEYVDTYTVAQTLQSTEFKQMRLDFPSADLFKIPAEPMFADSKILPHVPYLPNMAIPDPDNLGFVHLSEYLSDTEDESSLAIQKDPQLIKGRYVHTEIGNGVVVGVNQTNADSEGNRSISGLRVKVKGIEGVNTIASNLIYIINADIKDISKFEDTTPFLTPAEHRRAERQAERLAAKEAEAAAEAKRLRKLERAEIERQRLIDAALKEKKRKPKPEPVEVVEDYTVVLRPLVYNETYAFEAVPTADAQQYIGAFGFKHLDHVAYCEIPNKQTFDAVLDYLETNFTIPPVISKRLHKLDDSFVSGRGRIFNVELVPYRALDIKNLFLLRSKPSDQGKIDKRGVYTVLPELKVYPAIMDGALTLKIDIKSNPLFKNHLNKMIPGSKARFHSAELDFKFYPDRASMIADIKTMTDGNLVIPNVKELRAQIRELKVVKSTT